MKKKLFSLLLAAAMMCSMIPTAFAASTEAIDAANALHERGLFNGVGTNADGTPNFDLDRTPTRHEAVTMLVAMLGKSSEAQAGNWTTPFTDVADWAKPFVGYAYTSGLTSGTSATTYGGNQPVTATQYLTFVLTALGYKSGTDFQWNKAWELSDKLGITNGQYNATSAFTRGDVAIISHKALSAEKKDAQSTVSINSADYVYLAVTDFRDIRSNFPEKVAHCAYVYAYTDLNGDLCVLTDVVYKSEQRDMITLQNIYVNTLTLHNITKGTKISEPIHYYSVIKTDITDRDVELVGEIREHYMNMMNARRSVLWGGANTFDGVFVDAATLEQ